MSDIKVLDFNEKLKVGYCIPLWLRDEQIKRAITRVAGRIEGHDKREAPDNSIAIVGLGPSLNDTWEQLRGFKYIMTCSGAHKFLIERGIIPTWHLAVDPLPRNTSTLIETPHKDVEYLIASTCHQDVLDLLEGYNVKLWHVFSTEEDARRTLPDEEWAVTGGSSAGLRCLTMAGFLGFTDLHVLGLDGSEGASGKHADKHPGQPPGHSIVTYNGVEYRTTASYLECTKQIPHEMDQLPGVKATFYGTGLAQAIMKDYVPKEVQKEGPGKHVGHIAFKKPKLISDEYRELNRKLHATNLSYGVGGGKHANTVMKLAEKLGLKSILDYGCGKGYLAKAIPFPIWEYDPAVEGKTESPKPADLVCCLDVLEHIEPEKLILVLGDLARCVNKMGYFIIHTGASSKSLEDGRNAHLIQQNAEWWLNVLSQIRMGGKQAWNVSKPIMQGPLMHVCVERKK